MPVSPARLLALASLQCHIFNHTFNPARLRTGNKILRQRLKGPSVASYYPPRATTLRKLLMSLRAADPTADIDTYDEDEMERLDHLAAVRGRGKGAPKKKKGPPDVNARRGKKKAVVKSGGDVLQPGKVKF